VYDALLGSKMIRLLLHQALGEYMSSSRKVSMARAKDNSTSQTNKQLITALSKNHHSLVIMAPNEFVEFALIQKKSNGMTDDQATAWLESIVQSASRGSIAAKQNWERFKSSIKNHGSYLPVWSDAKSLAALALEMHRGGDILSKYRINSYGGKNYVVLKGYAGLRQQLNGTRYLANNPKVVSMAIGKLGAAKAITGGVGISVIFSVTFHALDQLMNDKATWHDFVAGVTVDVAAATAGAAISWGVVSTVVGATAMAAIGPIALVVVVGAGITAALSAIGDHYELTSKLAGLLKESERRLLESIENVKWEVRRGLNYAEEDPVGFMHRLFAVPYY
jgi:hypothetical protein